MMKKNILLCLLFLFCSNKTYAMTISPKHIVGIVVSVFIARYITLWIAESCAKKAIKQKNYTQLKILKILFPWLFKKGNVVPQILNSLPYDEREQIFYLIDIGTYVKPAVLLRACKKNDTELVRKCIDAGVNASKAVYKDHSGSEAWYGYLYYTNAIHFAAFYGNKEIVDMLLKAGVSINQRDTYYYNALFFAAWTINGLKIVDYLIEKGAERKSIEERAFEYVIKKKYIGYIKQDQNPDDVERYNIEDYFTYYRKEWNFLSLLPEEHYLFWQQRSRYFKDISQQLQKSTFAESIKDKVEAVEEHLKKSSNGKIDNVPKAFISNMIINHSVQLQPDDKNKVRQNILLLKAAEN